jgi:hypothetical protein
MKVRKHRSLLSLLASVFRLILKIVKIFQLKNIGNSSQNFQFKANKKKHSAETFRLHTEIIMIGDFMIKSIRLYPSHSSSSHWIAK